MTPRHRNCQSLEQGRIPTYPQKRLLVKCPTTSSCMTFSCLKDRKTPRKCLPSGKACGQNQAPRHRGMSRTPLILVTSIFLMTLRIRAIGRAQYAILPSHDKEKASTPAQDVEKEYEYYFETLKFSRDANKSTENTPNHCFSVINASGCTNQSSEFTCLDNASAFCSRGSER
jgi:hypothetical protein